MEIREQLEKPLIYLISEGKLTEQNFHRNTKRILQIIETAVSQNISFIQIREKQIPAKMVFELTSEAVKIAQNSNTKILVNDRADIAFAAKADGVHLTSNSIPTLQIRKNFPKNFIICVSTHSFEEANFAKNEGADFITFSPIFETASKIKYGKPQGLKKLNEICENLGDFPVIALGGINESNFPKVLEKNVHGFAGISFLNNPENLRKLNEHFKKEYSK